MFKPGTYVTNGVITGIVKGYSDDVLYNQDKFSLYGRYIHFYISFNEIEIVKNVCGSNDGRFRELSQTEIDEANKRLLEEGYKWFAESMEVVETKEIASTDNNENEQKFKTGDFLTSIDNLETFVFMRYDTDGWLLGWTIKFNAETCEFKWEVQRYNPGHPWQYTTDYDKDMFLRKLRYTCYVWYDDVKEIRKEYEVGVENLKSGDIIKLRKGETVIFKEVTSDKHNMRVWHVPIDGNILTEYDIDEPWRYATGDEQEYIVDILKLNGCLINEKLKRSEILTNNSVEYILDKDENHFFSNPGVISTNINSIVIEKPHEIPPINIPEGYRANIENGTIYFIKEFKDGDFIKTDNTIAIFKEISESGEIVGYVEYFRNSDDFLTAEDVTGHDINQWTHATEEDIKLFKEKLAKNNYKWDEERKKLVTLFWTPQIGEPYFFINRHFEVVEAKTINIESHQKRLSLHNCFKTKEDALEALEDVKKMFENYNIQKYVK